MQEHEAFNNPVLAKQLMRAIHKTVQKYPVLQEPLHIMEVCGTHTMEIGRLGIRRLLPENIELLSGPGCPVCVTPAAYLEAAIQLAGEKDVCLVTFGDMLHVPGKTGTLARMKAQGADIRVVTTPLQALTLAKEQPQKKYVFTAVGFETTAPVTAQAVRLASRERLGNLSFLVAHRIVPPVLKVLLEDPDLKLSGFLLPGHVSAIIGERAYTFLANYHKPGVIVGFESVDILSGLLTLLLIIAEPTHTSYLKNMYTRIVTPQGNCKARQVIEEVYEVKDAVLRGIGLVPGCGLKLKDRFSTYDAEVQYDLSMDGDEMPAGCACGQILKGVKRPDECPLFNSICTPQHPIGPCMVSSEGSCAAYYKYGY